MNKVIIYLSAAAGAFGLLIWVLPILPSLLLSLLPVLAFLIGFVIMGFLVVKWLGFIWGVLDKEKNKKGK